MTETRNCPPTANVSVASTADATPMRSRAGRHNVVSTSAAAVRGTNNTTRHALDRPDHHANRHNTAAPPEPRQFVLIMSRFGRSPLDSRLCRSIRCRWWAGSGRVGGSVDEERGHLVDDAFPARAPDIGGVERFVEGCAEGSDDELRPREHDDVDSAPAVGPTTPPATPWRTC